MGATDPHHLVARLDGLLDGLAGIVGGTHVLTDQDLRAGYETDWTGRYHGRCAAVVRPASVSEVAATLAYCDERRVPVVTQGGNTGLVGGGIPRGDDLGTVVLSTLRLDRVDAPDRDALQITAGAGATLAAVQAAAHGADLDVPVDFAARSQATIGGAVATNAGGSRVVRYGTMRRHVAGVEAVLADGTIVGSLAGLPKETAGLHWPSVLAGSEGTLAVITAVRLHLVPRFHHTTTAFVALESLPAAAGLAGRLRRTLPSLDAVELIEPEALDLVTHHLGTNAPVAAPLEGTYALVEAAADHDTFDELAAAIGAAPGVVDVAVAADRRQRAHIIDLRDRITEAIAEATAGRTPVFKLDVAVPLHDLAELLDIARRAAADAGARLIPFGHVAEGNVHLNYLDASDPEAIAAAVLPEVARLGGTISAEHGIGIAKARWLPLIRRADDLRAQTAIRRALDPNGILNPGVLEP